MTKYFKTILEVLNGWVTVLTSKIDFLSIRVKSNENELELHKKIIDELREQNLELKMEIIKLKHHVVLGIPYTEDEKSAYFTENEK